LRKKGGQSILKFGTIKHNALGEVLCQILSAKKRIR
jgi:hypothetical protein